MNDGHRARTLRRLTAHIKNIFIPGNTSRLSALKRAVKSGSDLISDKKYVVTVGGGTGTFVVLSALKELPQIALSAIVSVADDGGSTGRLRDAYGFLPHGDARQALVALAKDDTMLRDLFTYRFEKGDIAGHNLGNLFLTALTDRLGSDGAAIRAASEILRVRGNVVPVSEYPAVLTADLESGERLTGQHAINARGSGGSPIHMLGLEKSVEASKEAKKTIEAADMIILGPGDLYTSTLANFAVPGLKDAVSKSNATLVYFVNLFTNASETEGYSAKKHVEEITRYAGRRPDIILVHSEELPKDVRDYYAKKKGFPVVDDLGDDPTVTRGVFADPVTIRKTESDVIDRSLIRHDPEKVRDAIENLL
jgi:uncharacterized cofD-like protein